jgi:hypothetical protein
MALLNRRFLLVGGLNCALYVRREDILCSAQDLIRAGPIFIMR